MKRYGLLGHPLSHSFSAGYFSEKFEREGIDAIYENFDVPAVSQLPALLDCLPDLAGFNVTIPYKQAVIPFLDTLEPEAASMGAVNVVRVDRRAGGTRVLTGFNTDVIGFRESLKPMLDQLMERLKEADLAITTAGAGHAALEALVLGTGGASKAVCHGLTQLGISYVSVSRFSAPGRLTYEELSPYHYRTHRLIVNTTPLGMHPNTDTCPSLDYDLLGRGHLLFDLVYNPTLPRFLYEGSKRGALVKNGLEMLHLQAEAAWKLWQG